MSGNRLVVADAGWAETIPQWIKDEISFERLIYGMANIIKKKEETVGDAEVCAYLYTASLRAPIRYEWSQIYIYLVAKLTKRRTKKLPDFMKEKLKQGLIGDEQRYLDELKRDLYRSRGGEIDSPILNILRELKKGGFDGKRKKRVNKP